MFIILYPTTETVAEVSTVVFGVNGTIFLLQVTQKTTLDNVNLDDLKTCS